MKLLLGFLGVFAVTVTATQLPASSETSPILVVKVSEVTDVQSAQRSAFRHAQYFCSSQGQDARLTKNRGQNFYFDCVDRQQQFPFSVLLRQV